MRARPSAAMALFALACAGPPQPRPSAPPNEPVVTEGAATSTTRGSASSKPSPPAESLCAAPDELQVLRGSRLAPVLGTNYLHDEPGKLWLQVNGSELVRAPALRLDRLLGLTPEESEQRLRGARMVWAVGDAAGPRYALVQSGDTSCPGEGNFFLERSQEGWLFIDEPASDRSPPVALGSGGFDQGIVFIDSVNACGHAGPPFDYDVVARGATTRWPNPRRFTAPFMLGKQTFSEVAYSMFTVTPQGDVVVLGRRRRPDRADGFRWDGYALEIFRSGAKVSEIVQVGSDDDQDPTLVSATSQEVVLSRGELDGFELGTYGHGTLSWKPGSDPSDDAFDRNVDALLSTQRLVDGHPFVLDRAFRHANVTWLVGSAGDLGVTLFDGCLVSKTEPVR